VNLFLDTSAILAACCSPTIFRGNEIHALSLLNAAVCPDAYAALKEVSDLGIAICVCNLAARGRGYKWYGRVILPFTLFRRLDCLSRRPIENSLRG
jgi:hypothetical protein